MKLPCKSLVTAACFTFLSANAFAQSANDYSQYGLSPFEGFYAGAYGGFAFDPAAAGTVGGMAGVNYALTDGIILGVEAQGGVTFDTSTELDALMLGRLGYEIDDQTLVYGALGGGAVNGAGSYAVGGGAETIAFEQLGVRGEILGTGTWGGGLSAAKATAGVIWHVQ
jgi:outer membrane immunogenic protein